MRHGPSAIAVRVRSWRGADTGVRWTHNAIKRQYRGFDASTGTADHNYNWHDGIKWQNAVLSRQFTRSRATTTRYRSAAYS